MEVLTSLSGLVPEVPIPAIIDHGVANKAPPEQLVHAKEINEIVAAS